MLSGIHSLSQHVATIARRMEMSDECQEDTTCRVHGMVDCLVIDVLRSAWRNNWPGMIPCFAQARPRMGDEREQPAKSTRRTES